MKLSSKANIMGHFIAITPIYNVYSGKRLAMEDVGLPWPFLRQAMLEFRRER